MSFVYAFDEIARDYTRSHEITGVSFVYTFDDAGAAERKETQSFDTMGSCEEGLFTAAAVNRRRSTSTSWAAAECTTRAG